VSVVGEKAKFAKVTELPDAGGDDVVGEVAPYPEHPDTETRVISVDMITISGNDRCKSLFI
jgi:hypothetical protein